LRQQARLALQDPEVRYVLYTDTDGQVLLYQGTDDAVTQPEERQESLRTYRARIYRQPLFFAPEFSDAIPAPPARPEVIGEVSLGLSNASVAARQREILLASLAPAVAAVIVALWIAARLA